MTRDERLEALRALSDAVLAYSPREDHDWRCEYRTEEMGWVPGGPPVIRCECGFDLLQVALARARALLGDADTPPASERPRPSPGESAGLDALADRLENDIRELHGAPPGELARRLIARGWVPAIDHTEDESRG